MNTSIHPGDGIISIQGSTESLEISVFQGAVFIEHLDLNGLSQIDLRHYPPGHYSLVLVDRRNGIQFSLSIVII